MITLPDLRVQNFGASLKVLFVDNTDLTRNKRFTYLTEDVVSTGTTIRVQSIVGFESLSTSSGQIVLIGEIGNQQTEIVRTANTEATGTRTPSQSYKEIWLRDAMVFNHPQDTKIFILNWDRIDFQYAGTVTGTKTTISTYPLNIQPDLKETTFRDTSDPVARVSQSTAYYFARWNDTVDSRNSDWSDQVYGNGYDDNSVFAIKERALAELGEEVDGNIITHEFLNNALWEARREYHESIGKRPFRRKYNFVLGSAALTGSFRVELPADCEDPFSGENIYGVRIGSSPNMTFYDKKEWDFDYRNKPHSSLAIGYTYNLSTSAWLVNGADFADSVTIRVEGESIGLTRVAGYTGSSWLNSFRIYSHPTGGYSASVGSDVFANTGEGMPYKFTVWADPGGSAYIYFNLPIATAYVNQNIYLDYYRTLLGYDTDGDILDEPQYDMYVDYLKFRIKERRLKGGIPVFHTRSGQVYIADADYQEWNRKKNQALAQEFLGTQIRMRPDTEHLALPG